MRARFLQLLFVALETGISLQGQFGDNRVKVASTYHPQGFQNQHQSRRAFQQSSRSPDQFPQPPNPDYGEPQPPPPFPPGSGGQQPSPQFPQPPSPNFGGQQPPPPFPQPPGPNGQQPPPFFPQPPGPDYGGQQPPPPFPPPQGRGGQQPPPFPQPPGPDYGGQQPPPPFPQPPGSKGQQPPGPDYGGQAPVPQPRPQPGYPGTDFGGQQPEYGGLPLGPQPRIGLGSSGRGLQPFTGPIGPPSLQGLPPGNNIGSPGSNPGFNHSQPLPTDLIFGPPTLPDGRPSRLGTGTGTRNDIISHGDGGGFVGNLGASSYGSNSYNPGIGGSGSGYGSGGGVGPTRGFSGAGAAFVGNLPHFHRVKPNYGGPEILPPPQPGYGGVPQKSGYGQQPYPSQPLVPQPPGPEVFADKQGPNSQSDASGSYGPNGYARQPNLSQNLVSQPDRSNRYGQQPYPNQPGVSPPGGSVRYDQKTAQNQLQFQQPPGQNGYRQQSFQNQTGFPQSQVPSRPESSGSHHGYGQQPLPALPPSPARPPSQPQPGYGQVGQVQPQLPAPPSPLGYDGQQPPQGGSPGYRPKADFSKDKTLEALPQVQSLRAQGTFRIQSRFSVPDNFADEARPPIAVPPGYGQAQQGSQPSQKAGFFRGTPAFWSQWSNWGFCRLGQEHRTRVCDYGRNVGAQGCKGSAVQSRFSRCFGARNQPTVSYGRK